MTEVHTAPNGRSDYQPGPDPAPAPPGLPEWERKRFADLDGLDDFGSCLPYGDRRTNTVYPSVAADMLRMLHDRHPHLFAALHYEAQTGEPLADEPRQRPARARRCRANAQTCTDGGCAVHGGHG